MSAEVNELTLKWQNYDLLLQENQGRQARIEEITNSIAFKQEQINTLNEKFAETEKRLNNSEFRLEETIQELDTKRNELSLALIDLKNLELSLEQQKIILRYIFEHLIIQCVPTNWEKAGQDCRWTR